MLTKYFLYIPLNKYIFRGTIVVVAQQHIWHYW